METIDFSDLLGRQDNGPTFFGPTFQPTNRPTESDRKRPLGESARRVSIRSSAPTRQAQTLSEVLYRNPVHVCRIYRISVGNYEPALYIFVRIECVFQYSRIKILFASKYFVRVFKIHFNEKLSAFSVLQN